MIDPNHFRLSTVKQCALISVSRSCQCKGESPFNLKLMRLIDEQWLKTPFFGGRRMAKHADITYLPMRHGFMYLVAVMDWHSRKVLSWRLSNTLEADFCVAALKDAIAEYGIPCIFNTDQGSQFTSKAFTDVLKDNDIKISMDGKGAWMVNVFIERLCWSLKYECVHINEFENVKSVKRSLDNWINFYNSKRPHSSLDDRTPDEAYFTNLPNTA